jgi:hypothetical protein
MKRTIITSIILILFSINSYSQCSIFAVSDGDKILFGNNEDFGPAQKRIWINPPENDRLGTIIFGFDQGYNNYEGGMNDQGLCIDGAALRPTGWVKDTLKETIEIDVLFETILGKCEDFQDVEQLIENYNIESLKSAQFLIADKKGNVGVLIYHDSRQQIIRMDSNFQIITNFHYGNGIDPYFPERRFLIGTKMLEDTNNHSIEGFKKILFAIHQDTKSGDPTSYSNIYDLKNDQIYVYHFYNFSEPYIIDMNHIFNQGKQVIHFKDIFESTSFLFESHQCNKLIEQLLKEIPEKGFNVVIAQLDELEREYSLMNGLSGLDFDRLAYKLFAAKYYNEAIDVSKHNLSEHPKHAGEIYTYLAEAYFCNGDTTSALMNLRKAIEINPNAQTDIDVLNGMIEKKH